MERPTEIVRPETVAFVVYPAARTLLALLLLGGWAATWVPGLGGPPGPVLITGAVALALVHLGLRALRLPKERYELHADRIVWRRGALWWDQRVDLQLRNVTLVQRVEPWIEHRLLGTGRVGLRAAGAARAAIRMRGIADPAAMMDRLVAAMRENGFRLERRRLLERERPSVLGALILAAGGTLRPFFVGFLPFTVALFAAMGDVGAGGVAAWILHGDPAAPPQAIAHFAADHDLMPQALHRAGVAFAVALAFGIFAGLVAFVLAFIDRIKRVYRLYEDTIDFEDGFLTLEREIIPLENFSDSELEQSLIQRILGLSNLKLSGRGAGSDVRFWMMPGGPRFAERLDRLLTEAGAAPPSPEPAAGPPPAAPGRGPDGEAILIARPVDPAAVPSVRARPIGDTAARLESRMHPVRAVAGPAIAGAAAYVGLVVVSGLGLFLLPPDLRAEVMGEIGGGSIVGLLGPVLGTTVAFYTTLAIFRAGITVIATRYVIDGRKVAEHYRLLSTRATEFGHEKITGLTLTRGPIDRIFGCATLAVTSIGSAQPLRLRHVADWPRLFAALRARLDMPDGPPTETLRSEYRSGRWPRARPGQMAAFFLFAVGSTALGLFLSPRFFVLLPLLAGGFVALHLFNRIRYPRHRLAFHPTHAHHTHGVLIHKDILATWDSIKDLDSVRYIGLSHGTLELRVAGPLVTAIRYVDDVLSVHDALDRTLKRHPIRGGRTEDGPFDPAVLESFQPRVGAVCLHLVQLGLRVPLLLPLLPLLVPGAIPWIRRIHYRIEADRVVRERGLMLFRRRSILYNRVDHLESSRRFVDRLFGTGTLEVHTVGSQLPELTLLAVPDPDRRYELVERHLPRRGLPDRRAKAEDGGSGVPGDG